MRDALYFFGGEGRDMLKQKITNMNKKENKKEKKRKRKTKKEKTNPKTKGHTKTKFASLNRGRN